jgi:hypothetical protein
MGIGHLIRTSQNGQIYIDSRSKLLLGLNMIRSQVPS